MATAKKEQTTTIKVVADPEKPFRSESARDLYWQRIKKFNGKPLASLEKSVAESPPSMPKKGKLAGKQEPLSGWLSYFKNQGLISIETK